MNSYFPLPPTKELLNGEIVYRTDFDRLVKLRSKMESYLNLIDLEADKYLID